MLKPGAKLYCITDVLELHKWHMRECNAHPMFRKLSDEAIDADPCVEAMKTQTEEGIKVERNGGEKYYAVFERIDSSEVTRLDASNFFPIEEVTEGEEEAEES